MWLELRDNNGPIFVNMDNVVHFQRVEGQRRTTLIAFAANHGACDAPGSRNAKRDHGNAMGGAQRGLSRAASA